MNLTPKAVPPVVLVASKPRARLELLAGPKLIWPPVVWSPSVAPNLGEAKRLVAIPACHGRDAQAAAAAAGAGREGEVVGIGQ